MDLVLTTKYGHPAYIFEDLEIPESVDYGFFGKTLDVKPYKGRSEILLNNMKVDLVNQVHGVRVKSCSDRELTADGLIIESGQAGGIMTADCSPVILISKRGGLGCVLHCGWKSTFDGILKVAAKALVEKGAELKDFLVLIGPAAQSCCYEVGPEFLRKLEQIGIPAGNLSNIVEVRNELYFLSVPNLIEHQAIELGFSEHNIFKSDLCSICDFNFFSFRRQKDEAGRQLTLLAIK